MIRVEAEHLLEQIKGIGRSSWKQLDEVLSWHVGQIPELVFL